MEEEENVPVNDFVPVLAIGYLKTKDGKPGERIAVAPLKNKIEITSLNTAAMLLGVYECCENLIGDSEQNDFEKNTLEFFSQMMEKRFGYTFKLYLKDE